MGSARVVCDLERGVTGYCSQGRGRWVTLIPSVNSRNSLTKAKCLYLTGSRRKKIMVVILLWTIYDEIKSDGRVN